MHIKGQPVTPPSWHEKIQRKFRQDALLYSVRARTSWTNSLTLWHSPVDST